MKSYLCEFCGYYKFSDEKLFIVDAKNRKSVIDLLRFNYDISPLDYNIVGEISDESKALLLNNNEILYFEY